MAKTKTKKWDVVDHLKTKKDMAAYLEAVLEDGDPALIAAALGDIARAAGGIAKVARETGLGRESLYKALSPERNRSSPPFSRSFGRSACGWMPRLRLHKFVHEGKR